MTDDSETSSNDESSADVLPQSEPAPKIEGWLLLPAIGLVLSPIAYVVSLASDIRNGYLDQVRTTNVVYPGFLTAVSVTMLLEVVFFTFFLYVAVRFFKKHVSTPRLMIKLMVYNIALAVLGCVWFSLVFGQLDTQSLGGALRTIVHAGIWIPYFIFSKRVRHTFIVAEYLCSIRSSFTNPNGR